MKKIIKMKDKVLQWFLIMVFTAFAAALSLVQINSYHADKYHLNGLYWALSIVFGLGALFALYKTKKNSD